MAASANCVAVLERLIGAGHISRAEFQLLQSAIPKPDAEDSALDSMYTAAPTTSNQLQLGQHITNSAVTRVFNITELLERILVHVPHNDLLLRVPRTCQALRQLTCTSLPLRRRLFLEPDVECTFNHRLPFPIFGHTLSDPADIHLIKGVLANHGYRIDFSLNQETILRMREYPGLGKMLISQPPTRYAVVTVGTHAVGYFWTFGRHEKIAAPDGTGITIGDVLTAVDRLWRRATRDMIDVDENRSFGVLVIPSSAQVRESKSRDE